MKAILKKRDNETQWEFGLRIIESKIDGEIDLEWQDIVELLDLDVHRDSLRKATNVTPYSGIAVAKYYKHKIEAMMCEQGETDTNIQSLIDELEIKKIELMKEKVKISTLRSELNKTIRETSRKELFYEELHNAIINNPLKDVEFNTCYEPKQNKEYLLSFADVHYGSTFDVGLNKYSPEICEQRFIQLYNETVEIIKENRINHLHVASLGDLIQGILRITDLSLNSISMIEQILGVERLIANFLNNLSVHCNITYYHTINANHSELRLLGTKSGELGEDVELLIGNHIKDLLSNNQRVKVIIGDDTIMDINLCGYEIGLTHGQHIKNKENFIRDLGITRHKYYHYLILGHIHHFTCTTVSTNEDGSATQVISVPSMVGSCPYSKKIMKTSPSGGVLFEFTKEKGKTRTYEINFV